MKKSTDRKWRLLVALQAASLPLLLAACGSTPSKPDAAAPPEVSSAARSSFASAVAAMKAEQWAEAERELKQLLQSQPHLSGVHLNLALVYAQTQRPAEAESQFKQAIQVNPANMPARNQYGIWLRMQGRFKDAETVYVQALQANPEFADTHLNLGILYDLYLGNSAQALDHYQKYLALKGESADTARVKSWVADLQRRNKG